VHLYKPFLLFHPVQMLRLEKIRDSHLLRVIGRIGAENIAELKMQMQIQPMPVALELSDVTLVDSDAVRFLAMAEATGIELLNCPLFVREWIRRAHPDLAKSESGEAAGNPVTVRTNRTRS